jgi:type II secretory pathway predicted ATPase ExeA
MYLDYYGLKEEPFKITPDPKYFYTSRQHLEVLSCLEYAIEYRRGFGIVIGEAGSGKTTVGHVLLKKLDPGTKVAVITNTHLDERELIYTVLRELGEEVELEEKCVLLAKLNDFLIEELSRGGNPVLLIDEAQNLSPRVLEEVRMLANLETESEKLIQIIMMGQPAFEKMLKVEDLAQLQQRFSVGVRLGRLDLRETREYIHFRTNMAGAEGNSLFTDDAIDLIFEESSGIPRVINNVCDVCLINAYALGKKRVDGDVAREAVEERRQLFKLDPAEAEVSMKRRDRGMGESALTRSDVKRETQPRIGGSSPFEGEIGDRGMLRDFLGQADRNKGTSSDKKKDDDELHTWLMRAFDYSDFEGLVKSRRAARGGKLKMTSMPGAHDTMRDLLMRHKPQDIRKSDHRQGQKNPGFPAIVSLQKTGLHRRSHPKIRNKVRGGCSASVPYVKSLLGIEV